MTKGPGSPIHAVHGGAAFDAIGTDFSALERRRDVVGADVLDAWYDPAPSVVAAFAQHLTWLVKTSPPTQADGLERTVCEVRGLPPESVLVGGGSSNLIYLLLPQVVR